MKKNALLVMITLSRLAEEQMLGAGLPPWIITSVAHSQLLLAIMFAQDRGKPLHLSEARKMLQTELSIGSDKQAALIVQQVGACQFVEVVPSTRNKSAKMMLVKAGFREKLDRMMEDTTSAYHGYLSRVFGTGEAESTMSLVGSTDDDILDDHVVIEPECW